MKIFLLTEAFSFLGRMSFETSWLSLFSRELLFACADELQNWGDEHTFSDFNDTVSFS